MGSYEDPSESHLHEHSWVFGDEAALHQQASGLSVQNRQSACWWALGAVAAVFKSIFRTSSSAAQLLKLYLLCSWSFLVRGPPQRAVIWKPWQRRRGTQWKGRSSAFGTCLSWTTCCVLGSADAHPCNARKENKTTSHQQLLNAGDPISDPGTYRRQGDGTQVHCHGLTLPCLSTCCWLQVASEQQLPGCPVWPLTMEQISRSSEQWFLSSSTQPHTYCEQLLYSHLLPSPRTHLARVSGLMRMLKYVFFNCSVIISKTAGVKLKSDK